jgi:ribosome-associated heat shock protein Hsp15
MTDPSGQRLDKWLWFARLAKTRTLAAALVTAGKVRVNRRRVSKPGRMVQAEDVVTVAVHGRVRVLKIRHLGTRRGPAKEAQCLYEDMSPPPPAGGPAAPAPPGRREKGAGRPTKRERRRIEAWTAKGDPASD